MGIHNEPGIQKLPLKSTAELVETMLTKITETSDKDRSFVPFKGDGSDEVVLMVNDLGSISELEMGGITNEGQSYYTPCSPSYWHVTDVRDVAVQWLQKKNIKVKRVLAGTYMTSLNMPGFSLTLLLLPNGSDEPYSSKEILSLLDASASSPGWKYYSAKEPGQLDAKAAEVAVPKSKEVDLPRKYIHAHKIYLIPSNSA